MLSELPVLVLDGRVPTVEGASAELLRDLLATWREELESRSFPFGSVLSSGLSASEITARLAADQLHASPEVVAWFRWSNGQHWNSPWLSPVLHLASLDQAITDRSQGQPMGTAPSEWHPDWIRLCHGGVSLTVDTRADQSPRVRMVDQFGESTSEPVHHSETTSLCTTAVWAIDALRSGGHRWNADAQSWEGDREALDRIGVLHGYV